MTSKLLRQTLSIATAFLSLALVPFPATADDAPPSPKGPPPKMATAKLTESGELVILHTAQVAEQITETEKVTVTELRTEIIGGRQVAKPVETIREVPVVRTQFAEKELENRAAKDAFHVLDLDGKSIEGDALTKALASEKPVLFTYGKKPIDPFYASFFKPGTLVVHLHEAPPQPPQPAAPPRRAGRLPLRAVPEKLIPVPAVPERAPEAPPK